MANNDILFPNIGGAPGGTPITKEPAQAPEPKSVPKDLPRTSETSSFKDVLTDIKSDQKSSNTSETKQAVLGALDSASSQVLIKFSSHATSRLRSRGIDMSAEQLRKLSEAVDKAASKGLDDTLVLTKEAAFIVSVKNRTVVTAMDRSQMDGNVFTNIEGAVIMV